MHMYLPVDECEYIYFKLYQRDLKISVSGSDLADKNQLQKRHASNLPILLFYIYEKMRIKYFNADLALNEFFI